MKQVLQNIGSGETQLVELPCPQKQRGQLLISTNKSLISAGTERMLIDFGTAGLIQKARSQPEKVKEVLDKIKSDGLMPTVEAVRSKLDQPLPLGYCNVGVVQDSGGTGFALGSRVVSNGNHAEIVRVPENLCALIPDSVDDESAAFTVLAAIALQGIRLANPTIGETVVVTGLGLIGLITVQLLRANGCRVLGIDFDARKCRLARDFGAETVDLSAGEDPLLIANRFSRGVGVDAAIITASSKSNEPVANSAKMCRKRGRIILVGVVGLELSRTDFYEKELTFQVSCSYGPGRYDIEYEEKGRDYPLAFVRWTEQRNFEAVLELMSSGALDMKPLISHRFMIEDAISAYDCLNDPGSLGILLDYTSDAGDLLSKKTIAIHPPEKYIEGDAVCAFIGAGNYASRVLIPAIKEAGGKLDTLVTSGGVSAIHHGARNGFKTATTEFSSVLEDERINTIIVATQHNLHADQVINALDAGKNVFTEKPLALTHDELEAIERAYARQGAKSRLMVGYNRRFAPHVIQMKSLLERVAEPKVFILTMNAGYITPEHWTQDIEVGGGRIIGEACHYIDLMRFLAGSEISEFSATSIAKGTGSAITEDKASITLNFKDGSFGTINYLANGGKVFPKERIEVFANDGVLQLNNFKTLIGYDWKGFKRHRLLNQNKGHKNCAKIYIDAIKSGLPAPIPFKEIVEVARVSISVAELLRN